MENNSSLTIPGSDGMQMNPVAQLPSIILNQSRTTATAMAMGAVAQGARTAFRAFARYEAGKEYKIQSAHLPIFESLKKNFQETWEGKPLPHFWETKPDEPSKLIHIVSREAIIERYGSFNSDVHSNKSRFYDLSHLIITTLVDSIEAINKQWFGKDGQRAPYILLVTELLHWASTELLDYDPYDERIIEKLNQRLSYINKCLETKGIVPTKKGDEQIETSRNATIRVIRDQITQKIKNLNILHEHQRFENTIKKLRDDIGNVLHKSLQMQYMMLSKVSSNFLPHRVFTGTSLLVKDVKETQFFKRIQAFLQTFHIQSGDLTSNSDHVLEGDPIQRLQNALKLVDLEFAGKETLSTATGLTEHIRGTKHLSKQKVCEQILNKQYDLLVLLGQWMLIHDTVFNFINLNRFKGEEWTFGSRNGCILLESLIRYMEHVNKEIDIITEQLFCETYIPAASYLESNFEPDHPPRKRYDNLKKIVDNFLNKENDPILGHTAKIKEFAKKFTQRQAEYVKLEQRIYSRLKYLCQNHTADPQQFSDLLTLRLDETANTNAGSEPSEGEGAGAGAGCLEDTSSPLSFNLPTDLTQLYESDLTLKITLYEAMIKAALCMPKQTPIDYSLEKNRLCSKDSKRISILKCAMRIAIMQHEMEHMKRVMSNLALNYNQWPKPFQDNTKLDLLQRCLKMIYFFSAQNVTLFSHLKPQGNLTEEEKLTLEIMHNLKIISDIENTPIPSSEGIKKSWGFVNKRAQESRKKNCLVFLKDYFAPSIEHQYAELKTQLQQRILDYQVTHGIDDKRHEELEKKYKALQAEMDAQTRQASDNSELFAKLKEQQQRLSRLESDLTSRAKNISTREAEASTKESLNKKTEEELTTKEKELEKKQSTQNTQQLLLKIKEAALIHRFGTLDVEEQKLIKQREDLLLIEEGVLREKANLKQEKLVLSRRDIPKSCLPNYEKIRIAWDGRNSTASKEKLDKYFDKLIPREELPQSFHQYLHDRILVPYRRALNTYWPLSFFRRVNPNKVEKLRHTYCLMNYFLHMTCRYEELGIKQPSFIEMLIINSYLHKAATFFLGHTRAVIQDEDVELEKNSFTTLKITPSEKVITIELEKSVVKLFSYEIERLISQPPAQSSGVDYGEERKVQDEQKPASENNSFNNLKKVSKSDDTSTTRNSQNPSIFFNDKPSSSLTPVEQHFELVALNASGGK